MSPHPVLLCDVAVVSVDGELLRVEVDGVAVVAEELLVVLVERARVERDAAHGALHALAVPRLAVSGHHLGYKSNITRAIWTLAYNLSIPRRFPKKTTRRTVFVPLLMQGSFMHTCLATKVRPSIIRLHQRSRP